MNRYTLKKAVPILLVSLGLLGGCTSESYDNAQFGSSVRQMVKAQTLYPHTAQHPSAKPVEGVDGTLADNVLDQYRKSVSQPQQIHNAIQINVGQ